MDLKQSQVYIVDDDADARDAVAALVRTLGLTVHDFESAEQFLNAYRGARPACIVADLRMLGMSGLELLKELKTRGFTIPVIILTAHADTPTTVQAMKHGAYTTLDKPCRDSELWDTIRAALQDDLRRSEDDERRLQARRRLESLTGSEREVLRHLLAGDANKRIAHQLDVGLRTVETRRQSIFQKMNVESIAELVQQVMLADGEEARGI
jgi:two-component system, LuxR family, response regulator FixJ